MLTVVRNDLPALPSAAAWRRLSDRLLLTAGLILPATSSARVAARLSPRLRRLGLSGFDDYVALLDEDDAELTLALDLLTQPETGFFREPALFEALESEYSRSRPARLRLWNAGAGCGEETYSLAMLLADLQQAGRIGADWTVLGTDVSEHRLRIAAEALFTASQLAPQRLRRHTLTGAGGLAQIRPGLRERVSFMRHDLNEPLPVAEPFDAVLVCQLLRYFDDATRGGVISHLLQALRPGGLLLVGTAEQGLVEATGLGALTAAGDGAFRKN